MKKSGNKRSKGASKSQSKIYSPQTQLFIDLVGTSFSVGLTPDLFSRLFSEFFNSDRMIDKLTDADELLKYTNDGTTFDLSKLNELEPGFVERCEKIIDEDESLKEEDLVDEHETPEEFDFLTSFDNLLQNIDNHPELMDDLSSLFKPMKRNRHDFELKKPLPNAQNKTLKFKISIKGITKPPVWRQVEVPAYFNFENLHFIIQDLFGWENGHLWMFQPKAYDSNLTLQNEVPDDPWGNPGDTINPDKVKLTQVFRQKGDKFEYIYDFGDDWIHQIELKEIIDRPSSLPIVVKAKGGMMIEDIGGIFGYERLRKFVNDPDSLYEEEREYFLNVFGVDSVSEIAEYYDINEVDIKDLNELLSDNNWPRQ